MVSVLFSFVVFLLFFIVIAWYLRRALVGDIGISPTKLFFVYAVISLVAVYLLTDISLPTFFLLLLAVVSAYKVFDSILYGDLEWGYVLLFLVAAALLLMLSAQEISEIARAYLYTNSTNTTSIP